MIAVLDTTGLLVAYHSWEEWREDRRRDALAEPLPPPPPLAPSCGHCWGQARIFAPARNGEGLVPSPCPVCEGTGTVR